MTPIREKSMQTADIICIIRLSWAAMLLEAWDIRCLHTLFSYGCHTAPLKIFLEKPSAGFGLCLRAALTPESQAEMVTAMPYMVNNDADCCILRP